MKTYDQEHAIARQAAGAAGAVLLSGWGKRPAIAFKSSDVDLVTEYDGKAESTILAILAEAFPNDAIVGEEGGRRAGTSGRTWFVDPLDGTTNFSHGLPFFGSSIGLWEDGHPVVGVVSAPAMHWEFHAAQGQGAWLGQSAIAVSGVADLNRALLVTGFPYVRVDGGDNLPEFTTFMARSQGVRRIGSAALDLCFVACGWLDGFWERHIQPWDLVGGAAIVLEAGGEISDPDAGPFVAETGCILASNGVLHGAMRAVLAEVTATKVRN
jgi:myo-inositol-1(or 4)-monophosphatase